MPESLKEKIGEIALEGRGIAFKYLKNKQDSEDVVHDVFIAISEKLKQNEVLTENFKNTDLYMRNYIYRAINNEALNRIEHRKVKRKYIEDKDVFENSEGSKSKRTIEDKVETKILNPLEEFVKNRKDKFMKKYMKNFRKTLLDDENQLLDALDEVIDEEEKSLIARAAEILGITNDQGHNIARRIQRKLDDYSMNHPEIKDYKAKRSIFELPMFDFKLPSRTDDEDKKAAERMADRILKELDNDTIDLLSEIL